MTIKTIKRLFFLFACCVPLCFSGAAQTRSNANDTPYNRLLAALEVNPSDSLLGSIYDQVLMLQNAAIDREIVLRQKVQYADEKTIQLFKTKDSLRLLIGKQYEQPLETRKDIAALEAQTQAIEDLILKRVQRGKKYFMALSVQFAREVYRDKPSLENAYAYLDAHVQKGNKAIADQLYQYAVKKERKAYRWQQVRDELGSSSPIED